MLVMKDNYNNKIAPFGFDYVNNIVNPVDINISISIMDILSIQEVNLVYDVKFRFMMEWYDYRYATWMGKDLEIINDQIFLTDFNTTI